MKPFRKTERGEKPRERVRVRGRMQNVSFLLLWRAVDFAVRWWCWQGHSETELKTGVESLLFHHEAVE